MDVLATSLLMLAIAPTLPSPAQPTPAAPAEAAPELAQPQTPLGQSPATCPPGQFASAFSDVYPTDWAYEAVNRLAAVPVQCFTLPAEPLRSR